MSLELDRNGVPIYTGTAENFDEWREKALDLFWRRAGNEGFQGSTARALRGGLRDIAYEAVRMFDRTASPKIYPCWSSPVGAVRS